MQDVPRLVLSPTVGTEKATALLRRVFSLSRAESKFFRFQIEETDERSGGHDPVPRMRTWTRTRWRRGVETEQKMEKESKP